MNFEMAAEMADGDDAAVVTNDDVAVEDSLYTTGRRGVAGTLVVEKIVGAAAEAGHGPRRPQGARRPRQRATRSMGVALTSLHRAGRRQADLRDRRRRDGVRRRHPWRARPPPRQARSRPMRSPRRCCAAIVGDLGAPPRAEALLLRQRLRRHAADGALSDVQQRARRCSRRTGVTVARSLVGSYVTSLDMAGCSITLTMLDDEMAQLWDAPVHTAALRWGM